MRSHTHTAASSISIMRCATTLLVVEISLGDELGWVLEMRVVIVCRPCIHVEYTASWDYCIIVLDVFDTGSGQADWDDCPETENLLGECRDVWHLFLNQTLFPRLVLCGVDFHDLLIRLVLDVLTLGGCKIAQAHDHVAGYGVNACRDHGQADRLEFGIIQCLLWVFDDIASDTRLVCTVGNPFLEHVQESGQVFVPSCSIFGSRLVLSRDERQSQKRDIILPVVGGASEVGNNSLDMDNCGRLLAFCHLDRNTDENLPSRSSSWSMPPSMRIP
ncbi:hypothetical protein, variant 2 [Exophiala mesophila]|uniref:Uncharacterized protein n=1 Tax=Exophiala mesophila TaxID=212818 RepID=A0A0D1ZP54_EXOME|nr:uncharacterized protein PV10_08192 [Exophiala mesophila]XP_016220086.1 hypothetical protein, variant 1 [Exophiala mesophila]XP_016220087.1 hypothetical protein, variant 2 [Exophiala mesophila]KIV88511.1 hypothetical protein PV10_08192 [Exophiala mesophila]KIV88512.1 hypothetical protein, variant 1 [Exophiala mesophila]KIV88513.1 hypothetical protein, variant 2 [Exophiala mesophila]